MTNCYLCSETNCHIISNTTLEHPLYEWLSMTAINTTPAVCYKQQDKGEHPTTTLLTLGECGRVMVVILWVSVCVSVMVLPATYFVYKSRVWCYKVPYGVRNVCILRISLNMVCSPVLASFAYNCCLPCSRTSSRWIERTAVGSFQDTKCVVLATAYIKTTAVLTNRLQWSNYLLSFTASASSVKLSSCPYSIYS